MTAKCTLNGTPVTAVGPVGWSLQVGRRPHSRVFMMERGAAFKVLKDAKNIELVIEAAGMPKLSVKGLMISGTVAGSSPHTLGLKVVDKRWL